MMLTDLATACRKSGLTVVELSGWQTRARPAYTGGFTPKGVLAHHTGSPSGLTDGLPYAQWMATVGRSDLPAPLAQLGLGGDSTVYVLAAGRSNHAGTAKAFGGWVSAGDANSQLLGIEAMHPGAGPWPQYNAYVALCAALCDHYGWPRSHVAGHKETSITGKVDPGGIDMGAFRADIAAHNLDSAPTEEDDMAAEDVKRIIETVKAEGERTRKGLSALRSAESSRASASVERDRAVLEQLGGLTADLDQLAATQPKMKAALDRLRQRVNAATRVIRESA